MRISRIIITIIFLMSVDVIPFEAQDWDFTIRTVELDDEHSARIIPLHEDFDFMFSLLSGEFDAADFQREDRFILQCAFMMQSALARTGQTHLLPDVLLNVLSERWRTAANELSEYDIAGEIESALLDSAEYLPPRQNFSVCVIPVPPYIADNMSFRQGGFAFSNGLLLAIDAPESGDTDWQLSTHLMVAHEYHHVVRYSSPEMRESGYTLLTRLIVEGMAETFTEIVYPDALFHETLSPADESDIWAQIEPLLETTDRDTQNRFMFGGSAYADGDIPPLTGYRIGYRIMQSYIANNPTITLAEWTIMDAQSIFEASRYKP